MIPSPSTLFVFEAAARLGNFSHAAAELNITQPAVSHAVATLERHLDQQLFVRLGPQLSLTESGEQLSRATTRAFGRIEKTIDGFKRHDQDRETVMLSISSGMVSHWLMPRLHIFRQEFPQIDLQFQLLPHSVGGSLGSCDLGLRVVAGKNRERIGGWFAPERIMALGAPGYLRNRGSLEAPKHPHTQIKLEMNWFGWPEFLSVTGNEADPETSEISFPDYAVVVQTAMSGQGLVLGWTSVVSTLVVDGVLVPAADAVVETDRSYHLLSSTRRPNRNSVDKVRDWLISEMAVEERRLQEMFRGARRFRIAYS